MTKASTEDGSAERERLEREHGKLSDALWRLAGPYFEGARAAFPPARALGLAVRAWNLPFLSIEQQQRAIEEARLDEVVALVEIYLRRVREFASDPRFVLDFRLETTPGGEFVPVLVWISLAP